jgi:hypothetical protein
VHDDGVAVPDKREQRVQLRPHAQRVSRPGGPQSPATKEEREERDRVQESQEPKELRLIEGATHFDVYDRDQCVTPAVTKIDAFFRQHLSPATASTPR